MWAGSVCRKPTPLSLHRIFVFDNLKIKRAFCWRNGKEYLYCNYTADDSWDVNEKSFSYHNLKLCLGFVRFNERNDLEGGSNFHIIQPSFLSARKNF